jgi:protocatechuate 3,4-dioxygenase beta subunit
MQDASRRRFLELAAIGSAGVVLGCRGDDPAPDGADPVATDTDDTDPVEPDTDTGTAPVDTDTGAPASCEETPRDIEGPYWLPGVPVRDELDLYGDVGDRLTIGGTLVDTACAPLANAIVELWHADPDGVYDNDSPEMRYRGQIATGADGTWRFHTVMPGRYPGRPLHLHMKFWVGGVERLTTQVYFAGQPDNGGVPQELIVALIEDGVGAWSAVFDVVV